jgi:MFS family permease
MRTESIYRTYLLCVLLVILAFNNVDGIALGLFLQNIKGEFSLSDTQLGFLTGTSFAIFWAIAGVPIARWADRGNRVTVITLTTVLWAAAVMICGMAANFAQLLLIRVAVAVGEAGCMPVGNSLLADYFSREERPRAIARYLLGTPLSLLVGYLLAGWLNQYYGWRTAFMILGAPGLLLALLARFTIKEPRLEKTRQDVGFGLQDSGSTQSHAESALPDRSGLKAVARKLFLNKTYLQLVLAFSVVLSFDFARVQWLPAFFIRQYGMSTGELGTWLTIVYGLGGLFALYCGGELASRYAANNERLQLRVATVAYTCAGIVWTGVYLTPNRNVAFALLALNTMLSALCTGPLLSIIQTLVPSRLHAQSIAILFLFSRLIGLGLGPLVVGISSDAIRSWAGQDSLRYVLMLLCPGNLWAAWHLWRASRTVTRDIAAVDAESDTSMESISERIAIKAPMA